MMNDFMDYLAEITTISRENARQARVVFRGAATCRTCRGTLRRREQQLLRRLLLLLWCKREAYLVHPRALAAFLRRDVDQEAQGQLVAVYDGLDVSNPRTPGDLGVAIRPWRERLAFLARFLMTFSLPRC